MAKITPPFVRNPFNYDVDAVSSETGLLCEDVSLTVQSEADDADINVIVRRFGVGNVPTMPLPEHFGNFDGIFDFQTAMNTIRSAQETFNALPADVRSEFNNDPHVLISKLSMPSFRARAVELGLVVEQPSPAKPDVDPPKEDAKQ